MRAGESEARLVNNEDVIPRVCEVSSDAGAAALLLFFFTYEVNDLSYYPRVRWQQMIITDLSHER